MNKILEIYEILLAGFPDPKSGGGLGDEEAIFLWISMVASIILGYFGLSYGWSIGGIGGAILFLPIGFLLGTYIGFWGSYFILNALAGIVPVAFIVSIIIGLLCGLVWVIVRLFGVWN
ncbi:MAG: hypothetical protein GY941_20370 [Planctomycetes bacterium]|nr:hypothetical protein [Planctomycetota bacterium]